jgi:hypothetical protein
VVAVLVPVEIQHQIPTVVRVMEARVAQAVPPTLVTYMVTALIPQLEAREEKEVKALSGIPEIRALRQLPVLIIVSL